MCTDVRVMVCKVITIISLQKGEIQGAYSTEEGKKVHLSSGNRKTHKKKRRNAKRIPQRNKKTF